MGKTKINMGEIMEHKIIRVLTWVQFIMLFTLVMVHMFKCYNWLPLTILFIPSIGAIWVMEKEWKND